MEINQKQYKEFILSKFYFFGITMGLARIPELNVTVPRELGVEDCRDFFHKGLQIGMEYARLETRRN